MLKSRTKQPSCSLLQMGPNMLLVEKLEKNGIKRLDQIQPFAEQNDLELAVDLSPYAYYIVGCAYPIATL